MRLILEQAAAVVERWLIYWMYLANLKSSDLCLKRSIAGDSAASPNAAMIFIFRKFSVLGDEVVVRLPRDLFDRDLAERIVQRGFAVRPTEA